MLKKSVSITTIVTNEGLDDNTLKTLEDKRIFFENIVNPPSPNEKLKKAQIRYEETAKQKITNA